MNACRLNPASRTLLSVAYIAWLLCFVPFTRVTAQVPEAASVRAPTWASRWKAFEEQRLNPDGSRADARAYVEAAAEIAAAKRSAAGRLAGSGWYPVGPFGTVTRNTSGIPSGIGRINCIAFHPTDSSVLWVGVAQGGVWKSADGGRSWRPLTDDLPILRISDIAVDPTNPDVLYISVGDFAYIGVDLEHADRKRHTHFGLGVYKSTDGGSTWNPTGLSLALGDGDASLIRRVFIHPANTARLFAAGAGGTWSSSDAGATWTRGRTDIIWDIERDPSNPNLLHASTGYLGLWDLGGASLIRSSDFGETWAPVAPELPAKEIQRIELAVAPSNPQIVYAVSCNLSQGFHSFHRSTDRGATWRMMTDRLQGLNILSYDGKGVAGQGAYDLTILVDPENPSNVVVGGIVLWGSSDGGISWDVIRSEPELHPDQHFLSYNPLNGRIYLCNDGGIRSTGRLEFNLADGAPKTTWLSHESGLAITSFYRVGISRNNPGYLVAGAQDNASFYYDGRNWSQLFSGDGMDCFIDHDDPKLIFGSWQFGTLRVSRDGGLTNRGLPRPAPQMAELGEWTTPFASHPTNPRTHFVGYGNLYRSDEDDTVWQRRSNFEVMMVPGSTDRAPYPTPITAMAISSTDSLRYYITKKIWHPFKLPSQAWTTSDGGMTWQDITAGLPDSLYPTSIATHPTNPLIAWVTYSGFVAGVKVFATTDAGVTWANVSRNLPNVPVNVVAHDPASDDNTLYVGTDIGVFATSDRADAWEPFGDNLPNVIVSDLELHPLSRTLYAATFGRGVWGIDLAASGARAETDETLAIRVLDGPAPGSVIVEATGASALGDARAEIIDVLGRIVHSSTLDLGATPRVEFPVRLVDGLYFLRVVSSDHARTVRFVVGR